MTSHFVKCDVTFDTNEFRDLKKLMDNAIFEIIYPNKIEQLAILSECNIYLYSRRYHNLFLPSYYAARIGHS